MNKRNQNIFIRLSFILLLGIFSCSSKNNQSDLTINTISSGTKTDLAEPFLFSNGKELFLSWVEAKNDSIFELKYSILNKGRWTQPLKLASGDNWFVNWADFPAIAENNNKVLSHYLAKSSTSTYAYDVHLVLAEKGGSIINPSILLNNDKTPSEHGFVTLVPYKKDSFFVTWLDGRNTVDSSEIQAMNIRSAIVTNSGEVISDLILDYKTCDCCQTSAAITDNGPVVVYRDRSDTEVRDMSITRLVNNKWTEPKTIYNDNWQIKGCPVNGPKASSIGNDLAIAWFTAANDKPVVKVIHSSDGGDTFNKPIIISQNNPVGRVDIIMINSKEAVVSWLENNTHDQAEIRAMKVNLGGEESEHIVISTSSSSRSSGFPQMELLGNKVYFAWTDVSNESSIIQTTVIDIERF